LRERVRVGDLAARLGGDEFGVICPDTGLEAASALAEDLQARIGELATLDGSGSAVTLSIGAASRKAGDLTANDVVQRADDRLYSAKRTRTAVDLTAG
jgi:diguanylate cyclase (GGDEF)-like protein